MISSVVLLLVGSAICGWATNGTILIAGRAIQGLGGGGINMLVELIVCDLVPVRERSKFMGKYSSIYELAPHPDTTDY